jgi:hypothetical protein
MPVQTQRDALGACNSHGPSFLFIGTAKAGSNWFFEILSEHPAISVPPNRGTFFFTRMYRMGVDWYEGFFARSHGPRRISGEVCEDYLSSPEALSRIHGYRPGMRLICCLRNPYERAISQWYFYARNGVDEPTLAAQGSRHPELYYLGYYATQLKALRRLFPEEQTLVFLFEELSSAPAQVARRMYEFLGVDPGFSPPSLTQRVNGRAAPRSRLLARLVNELHMRSWSRSRTYSNVLGRIKRIRKVRLLVRRALYRDWAHSPSWRDLIGEFPSEVRERYEAEISELELILQRDLSAWRAPAGLAVKSEPAPELRHSQAAQSGWDRESRDPVLQRATDPDVP